MFAAHRLMPVIGFCVDATVGWQLVDTASGGGGGGGASF